ncbi:CPBP family intramembrane glutamic endopeptidase [Aquabacterium sp.]|uniref:CPBP family intramembrane glutamic endopeptidase n=1 Tax=Aquabacterium sp. TaxID=1872578 RepID=UPI002488C3B5|nr:CPBP family intramembrane glutamic endopeptidase [Aquabacterium sp.]MDI1261146.1 CPBP family intramembrane metalloprotease [Aquabacterium sp.]
MDRAAGGLGLALAVHVLPGFHNPLLVNAVRTTPDAVPFTLYANFDKGSVGLLLLACLAPRLASWQDARAAVAPTLVAAVATAAAAIGAAWLAGQVRFEPKLGAALPPFAPTFLFVNLFFTCVAEEAFFRGLIQERLTRALAHRPGLIFLPILVSATLFGLAHLGGGPLYMAFATLAGLGYAGVYAKTRRVEAAVVTHFAVNATHFIFFTYPALGR